MENQVWLVTGASQGIGIAIVKAVIEKGSRVVAFTRNSQSITNEIKTGQDRLKAIDMDITSDSDTKRAVEEGVRAFGKIDVVVNNAGYAHKGAFEEISDASIRKEFDVNVFGLMNVTRHVLPILRKQRSGIIFNVSSVSGLRGTPINSVYCASKHAVNGFSESLRYEVEPFGIKVITVMPGLVRTNFLESTSLKRNELHIDDYDQQTKDLFSQLDSLNGKQDGDPYLCAQVLIETSKLEKPPLNLFLGADGVSIGLQKLSQINADVSNHLTLMSSTAFKE